MLLKDAGAWAGEASPRRNNNLQTAAGATSLCISGGVMSQASEGKAAAADPPALGGRGVRSGGAQGAGLGAAEPQGWGQCGGVLPPAALQPPLQLLQNKSGCFPTTRYALCRLMWLYGANPLCLPCPCWEQRVWCVWALGDAAVRNQKPRQQQCQGKITILGRLHCHSHSRLIICLRIT